MASIAQGGAIFIGSLPYSSSEEAFTAISHAVGDHIRYLCDGETGERWNFVEFQTQRHPSSLLQAFAGGTEPKALSQERYDEMYEKHETDYDTAAVASYAVFKKLKATGKIPKHVRFQVCVATPVNVMGMIAPQHRPMVEQYYERSLNRALRVIQDSIPHEELVIQRDMSAEFCMLEEAYDPPYTIFKPWFGDSPEQVRAGVLDKVIRSVKGVVDDDVPLGVHLCYGDYLRKHFVQPKDTGTLALVAKTILEGAERPIAYIHTPVPADRTDKEYFVPLQELKPLLAQRHTELYLGLLHPNDEDGSRKRMAVAREMLGEDVAFGIASECGLGRADRVELEAPGGLFEQVQRLSAKIV